MLLEMIYTRVDVTTKKRLILTFKGKQNRSHKQRKCSINLKMSSSLKEQISRQTRLFINI